MRAFKYCLFMALTAFTLGVMSGALGSYLGGEWLRWTLIVLVCGTWGGFYPFLFNRMFPREPQGDADK